MTDQSPNSNDTQRPLTDSEIIQAVNEMENTIYVYSFYDTKAKRYDTPFYCKSDLFAQRHYQLISEKEGTLMHRFSDDFKLHRLAAFDQITSNYKEMFANINIGE